MNFLKKILHKIPIAPLFGSNRKELKLFAIGLGKSSFTSNDIIFKNYPFRPSIAFKNKKIHFSEIDACHLDEFPPTLKVGKELIFISKVKENELKNFAINNHIKIEKRPSNWNWITEPFLDTEFTDDDQQKTLDILSSNGITKREVIELRSEIEKQMYKYNFDTMLWEWCNLGLLDVLFAMNAKYNEHDFEQFYWMAMEIEQRSV